MNSKPGIIILGAGGVGSVAAHKAAQNASQLGDITIASRTLTKAEAIKQSILDKGNLADPSASINCRQIDAKNTAAVADLIRSSGAKILVNVASNHTNLAVMEACLQTGCAYLDKQVVGCRLEDRN